MRGKIRNFVYNDVYRNRTNRNIQREAVLFRRASVDYCNVCTNNEFIADLGREAYRIHAISVHHSYALTESKPLFCSGD